MDPRPAPAPRRRSGIAVVVALVAMGLALAVVTQAFRIPGSAPRLRMFPSEEEAAGTPGGWTLPPTREVAARPVARVRVVVRGGGTARVALPAAGGAVGEPDAAGVRVIEFPPPGKNPPPTEPFTVSVDGGPPVEVRVPVRLSTRDDARDAPVYRIEVQGK